MPISRRALLGTAALLPAARAFAWIPERPRPRDVAAAALAAAKAARFADVRLVRRRDEVVNTRDDHVIAVRRGSSYGIGVRVVHKGAWGFAAVPDATPQGARTAAERAMAIAEANAALRRAPVELASEPAHKDTWQTPIEKDPLRVPVAAKAALLIEANAAARTVPGIRSVRGHLESVAEEKAYFSSEGSAIEQMLTRVAGSLQISAVGEERGDFETRHIHREMGGGYEEIEALRLVETAPRLAREAREKLKADRPRPGKRDLVLDPSHLWLTIHESIGHSTELDRVLGFEANFAGTSFATVDKLGTLRVGSPLVSLYADRTTRGGLATCAYDDDGAATSRFDLIKDGVLVAYQTVRDQRGLPGFGGPRSGGCSYAQSWAAVPFQRMPNVSLAPGASLLTLEELIASTESGIYIAGNGSYSIDHQRRHFQFGGDMFWEIEKGKLARPLRRVAYAADTVEFWSSCDAICDAREFRLHGSFNDGKGEPSQSNAVSHGCPPARFRGIQVLDASGTRRRRAAEGEGE